LSNPIDGVPASLVKNKEKLKKDPAGSRELIDWFRLSEIF
jgi:hypothetical protein